MIEWRDEWKVSPVVLSSSESSSSTFDGLDESANAKEFSKHPLNRKMESLLRRFTGDHGPKAPTTTDRIAERMRAHHRRRLEHYIELRKRCRNGSGQSRPAALQFLDGIIEALEQGSGSRPHDAWSEDLSASTAPPWVLDAEVVSVSPPRPLVSPPSAAVPDAQRDLEKQNHSMFVSPPSTAAPGEAKDLQKQNLSEKTPRYIEVSHLRTPAPVGHHAPCQPEHSVRTPSASISQPQAESVSYKISGAAVVRHIAGCVESQPKTTGYMEIPGLQTTSKVLPEVATSASKGGKGGNPSSMSRADRPGSGGGHQRAPPSPSAVPVPHGAARVLAVTPYRRPSPRLPSADRGPGGAASRDGLLLEEPLGGGSSVRFQGKKGSGLSIPGLPLSRSSIPASKHVDTTPNKAKGGDAAAHHRAAAARANSKHAPKSSATPPRYPHPAPAPAHAAPASSANTHMPASPLGFASSPFPSSHPSVRPPSIQTYPPSPSAPPPLASIGHVRATPSSARPPSIVSPILPPPPTIPPPKLSQQPPASPSASFLNSSTHRPSHANASSSDCKAPDASTISSPSGHQPQEGYVQRFLVSFEEKQGARERELRVA